ncbi:hypothetical protein BH09MYX1_BH09MYX1_29780 [soil metagenome]
MHTTLFAMKHAHLSALRLARVFTQRYGLTPARLDMLRVIMAAGGSILQLTMRHRLSVTKPVISVMVRSLEKLKFVTRERCEKDRRTFVVKLTEEAIFALRAIFYEAIVLGVLKVAFLGAFLSKDGESHRGWELAMVRMEARLQLFRRAFGLGTCNPWDEDEPDEDFYYEEVPENPAAFQMVPDTWEMKMAREARWEAARYCSNRKWRRQVKKQRARELRLAGLAHRLAPARELPPP